MKRAEFEREIIAGGDECGVAGEFAAAEGWCYSEAFGELVGLVEEAGVAGRGPTGGGVGTAGGGGFLKDIKIAEAEAAVDDRVPRVQASGGVPIGDGFAMAAAVVEPVAEGGVGAGIAGIGSESVAEDRLLFKACRDSVVAGGAGGGAKMGADDRGLITD